jgi:hypothetical protein
MMRSKLLWIPLIALTAACSKGSSPSGPSTPQAPRTFIFTATLLPSNEVPPVTNAEAGGQGNATITLTVTVDNSGTITAATTIFTVALSGFPGGTTLTAAHIHEGGPTCACPVKVQTTLASGEVVLGANGSGGFTKTNIATPADVATAMINTPSNYYFNVHTTTNPGGAARGVLIKN